jgi:hypothetical protein
MQNNRSIARSVIVGGPAEKYAHARSGDTTFFIYLQTEHKKQGEKLEQKHQCRLEHGEETINMSEEGDEIERRDIANDLIPCSGAFE